MMELSSQSGPDVTRLRRRLGSINLNRPDTTQAVAGPSFSPLTRLLKTAQEETPDKLRHLEEGWRARRRTLIRAAPTVSLHPTKGTPIGKWPRPRAQLPGQDSHANHQERAIGVHTPCPVPTGLQKDTISRGQATLPTPPPTPSPSTSPLQLPPVTTDVKRSLAAASSTLLDDRLRPSPIIAGALPPTNKPTIVTKGRSETICILPPESPYEMLLNFPHRRSVRILRNGLELQVMHNTRTSVLLERTLRLIDASTWKQEDQKLWATVFGIIEGVKSRMARAHIWHLAGRISISCNVPPDITLDFSTPVSDCIELPPSSTECTKVRVSMSVGRKVLRIDTARKSNSQDTRTQHHFRTQRVVSLPLSNRTDRRMDGEDHRHMESARLVLDTLFQTLTRLAKDQARSWLRTEREGLQRLIQTQNEWSRWIQVGR